MKNTIKLIAIIAITAVIGFAFITCDDGNNNGGTIPTGTPIKTLTGITAEYEPTTELFPDTTHDTLKEGLTVKAQYSDNTNKTLNDADYSLSGDFTVGESVITVSYTEGGVTKTATFKITVDPLTHEHNWQFKKEITPATCTDTGEEQWECSVISTPHHEDRETAALGHIWEWEVDTPSVGIDTQVCSRCSQEGETRYVFATVTDMTAFLSNPATDSNTLDTPYNIKLNVASLPWTTTNAAQTALSDKYVNLDLSGSTLTTIGGNAFRGCTGLADITIPASVTSIGTYAFYGCTGLTGITIPEGVTSIDTYVFYGCTSLASITIPEGVTSIGGNAFDGCTSLASITIPASVTSIGNRVFNNCTGLTSIIVDTNNSNYSSEGGILYNKAKTSLIQAPLIGITGTVTIPASVTSIEQGAFYGCTSLTSVTIPNSVTSIGNGAFQNCTGLTSVTITEGVTSIGEQMFMNCASLASVTIPNSVTSIGARAFYGCTSLTSVTFEGTILSTGFYNGAGVNAVFSGDLRAKFYTGDSANGVPGTYIITGGTAANPVWTKQS